VEPVTERDLRRWAEALAGIAQTGLAFSENLYERERFEEVLSVAGEIKATANHGAINVEPPTVHVEQWVRDVQPGRAGYATPKTAVGAVVVNDANELLLIQRADSGLWLYPTGYCDVGYSAVEVVVKEVKEETGIDVEPLRLIGILDTLRLGSRMPLYSMLFLCRATSADLLLHPLECSDAGWFTRHTLPSPLLGGERWVEPVFAAIDGQLRDVFYDDVRTPVWRTGRE
jgi:ADP-ribose pyrophosphatase YjhB (NUDIX family)